MDFKERLRKLRVDKGITQEEFGKIFNVIKQTVSSWENGNSRPDIDSAAKIADFFDVSLDYLLGRTNETSVSNSEVITKIDHALLEDPELLAFWDETKKRPDLQLFLKQVKSASPKAIRQMMTIIKMIEDEESGEK
ncbi:helix-turn-helix transcriptional regulator [Anaerospora sp.]|uniref:helix-turn-helix domain-containing protein n=1 Tax=Anaerospora sp. TaxID=1960278 RepID=UPI0028A0302C|nr:helix-turn-helix transcriptional regulator [Anaerospora sp.]